MGRAGLDLAEHAEGVVPEREELLDGAKARQLVEHGSPRSMQVLYGAESRDVAHACWTGS